MKLKIETHGKQGPSIVFFHGWGFDSHIWHALLPELTSFSTVYLVDLPGYGYSSLMTWDEFVVQLNQHLPPSCYAVGWSLGGAYAMRLAWECPHLIKQFVAVSSSPKFIAEDNWPGITTDGFDSFMAKFKINPEKTLSDFLKLQSPRRSHLTIGRMACIDALEEGLALLKSWDARDALQHLQQGAFLFGKLDAIVPAATHHAVKTRYPQFDCLLLNSAAHAPFLSHTDEFIAYLKYIISPSTS